MVILADGGRSFFCNWFWALKKRRNVKGSLRELDSRGYLSVCIRSNIHTIYKFQVNAIFWRFYRIFFAIFSLLPPALGLKSLAATTPATLQASAARCLTNLRQQLFTFCRAFCLHRFFFYYSLYSIFLHPHTFNCCLLLRSTPFVPFVCALTTAGHSCMSL